MPAKQDRANQDVSNAGCQQGRIEPTRMPARYDRANQDVSNGEDRGHQQEGKFVWELTVIYHLLTRNTRS